MAKQEETTGITAGKEDIIRLTQIGDEEILAIADEGVGPDDQLRLLLSESELEEVMRVYRGIAARQMANDETVMHANIDVLWQVGVRLCDTLSRALEDISGLVETARNTIRGKATQ